MSNNSKMWNTLINLHLRAANTYQNYAATFPDPLLKNMLLDQSDQHRSMIVRLNYLMPEYKKDEISFLFLSASFRRLWTSVSAFLAIGDKSDFVDVLTGMEADIWASYRDLMERGEDMPEEVFRWVTVHQQRSKESIDRLKTITANLFFEQATS